MGLDMYLFDKALPFYIMPPVFTLVFRDYNQCAEQTAACLLDGSWSLCQTSHAQQSSVE